MAKLLARLDDLLSTEGDPAFRLDSWIDTAPFEDLIGIDLLQVDQGRATLGCQARVKLAQGGGVVHGGALTTLADTAVAMAIKSLLPEGSVFATTELQMKFLRPVRSGYLKAVAAVDGPQGRSFYGQADIFDADGSKVAEFTSTFRVARDQPLRSAGPVDS